MSMSGYAALSQGATCRLRENASERDPVNDLQVSLQAGRLADRIVVLELAGLIRSIPPSQALHPTWLPAGFLV